MNLSRRLLYASDIWEVARPRTALTAGHLLIRLSNPAIAFDLRSAADWLVCAGAARRALAEVLGATGFAVVFAHQWHPIGSAIGEPEVESSTPTFHLFGRWDGETVSPGGQLRLPAQRRLPVAASELVKYDDGLRAALRRSALARAAAAEPEAANREAAGREADVEAARRDAGVEAPPNDLPAVLSWSPEPNVGPRHTMLATDSGTPHIAPADLLAAAAALPGLVTRLGVSGLSCIAADAAGPRLEIHALGRSVGEPVNPLELLLKLPEVSQALL
ncbi:hypothetical protein ACS5PJ_22160 [Pseudarthrobacter sp. YS3]|uniref:hypothetical protein n=1 Tax=Pseudarthrobacter sp. YS3 TaxID=3453718 RepID=UPI003EE90389